MSDLAVVQRVLDFWDPLGTSLCSGGSIAQIDEYDAYSLQCLDMLKRGLSQAELCEYLNQIRFKFIGLKITDENEADNRFYSWALVQTWNRQLSNDSNLRLTDTNIGFSDKQYKRRVSSLEIVQQILQDWDPLEKSKLWLFGADTLKYYDELALIVLDVCEKKKGIDEICVALQMVQNSENDKVSLLLQNWANKEHLIEQKFQEDIRKRSVQNKWLAANLEIIFMHLDSYLERYIDLPPRLSKS